MHSPLHADDVDPPDPTLARLMRELPPPRTTRGLAAPLTPDQRAALEAIGVKFGTGMPLKDFKPLPMRPKWLAFLLRIVRRG